nr:MAG TPA: hypothetical protein [Caudoviricetes sp.]
MKKLSSKQNTTTKLSKFKLLLKKLENIQNESTAIDFNKKLI